MLIHEQLRELLKGKGMLEEVADNEQFKSLYAEQKENEKRINARLISDGFGSLEAELWSDHLKKEEE